MLPTDEQNPPLVHFAGNSGSQAIAGDPHDGLIVCWFRPRHDGRANQVAGIVSTDMHITKEVQISMVSNTVRGVPAQSFWWTPAGCHPESGLIEIWQRRERCPKSMRSWRGANESRCRGTGDRAQQSAHNAGSDAQTSSEGGAAGAARSPGEDHDPCGTGCQIRRVGVGCRQGRRRSFQVRTQVSTHECRDANSPALGHSSGDGEGIPSPAFPV